MPARTLPQDVLVERPLNGEVDGQNSKPEDCAIIDEDDIVYVGFGLMPSVTLPVRTSSLNSPNPRHQSEEDNKVVMQTDETTTDHPEVIHSPRQALLAAVEKFFMPQLTSPVHSAHHTHSRNSSAKTITPRAYANAQESFSSDSHASPTPSRSSFTSISSFERQPEKSSTTTTSSQQQQQAVLQDTSNMSPYYLKPDRYTPGIYDNYYQKSTQGIEGGVSFDTYRAQSSNDSAFPRSEPSHESVCYNQYVNSMAAPIAAQPSLTIDHRKSSFRVSSQDVRFTSTCGDPTSYIDINEGAPVESTMGPAYCDEGTKALGPDKGIEYSGKRQLLDWKPESNPTIHPRSFKIDTRGFSSMDEPEAAVTAESLAEAVSVGPLESIVFTPSPINRTAFTLVTFVSEIDATTFWKMATEAYTDNELIAFEASRRSNGAFDSVWAKRVRQIPYVVEERGVPETTMTLMQSSEDQGELFIGSKPMAVTRVMMEGVHDRGSRSGRIIKSKGSTRVIVLEYLSSALEPGKPEIQVGRNEVPGFNERANQTERSENTETPKSHGACKPLSTIPLGFQGEHDLRADIWRMTHAANPKASNLVSTPTSFVTKFEVFGDRITLEPNWSMQTSTSNTKSWADMMEEQECTEETNTLCSKEITDVQQTPNSAESVTERSNPGKEARDTTVVIHFADITNATLTRNGLSKMPKYQRSCKISFGKERLITAKHFREQRLRQACDHLADKITDI
ncbi:MAG: hypothetical protein M1812_003471 [Candelaria pacifica]|nr:MAG: hypothetical protein M1812_003471 [Candelaria pacifica]